MINIHNKRIIITKTNQIGDVTFALPIASALKQADPSCHIIFLGRSYSKALIEHYQDVDAFADYDQMSKAPSDDEAIHYLKTFKADIIIHVYPQKQLARLAKRAGIPIRVGNIRRLFLLKYCNRFVYVARKKSSLHESQLDMLYLKPFLKKTNYSLSEIIKLQQYKPFAKTTLNDRLAKDKFNLILHPLTRGRHIEWSFDHFAQLIEKLPDETFQIFLTGSEEEGALFRETLVNPFPNVIDLSGKTSLNDLIGFIQQADGLIAAATGPVHLAANFDIKTLGLYAPIKPFHAGRWGPIGKQVTVLSKQKNCSECRYSRCHCINEITPDEVAKVVMAWGASFDKASRISKSDHNENILTEKK